MDCNCILKNSCIEKNFDIQKYAEFLYRNIFIDELEIPVVINNRLKRTIAWFVYEGRKQIEVSNFLILQDIYVITDVLLHELTHYYLYKHGFPFDDLDKEFIEKIKYIGASETNTFILKEKLKCQYTKFIATHEKCNFSRAIYLKESEINDEPLFCECKGCKKKLKYKKEKEELLDYIPNKKIKGYVDVWKRLK